MSTEYWSTALRETREELGLLPRTIAPLGWMVWRARDHLSPGTRKSCWGSRGAGILFWSPEDDSVLLARCVPSRLWGIPGGALPPERRHDCLGVNFHFVTFIVALSPQQRDWWSSRIRLDQSEHDQWGWFSLHEDVPNLPLHPGVEWLLGD